MQSKEFARKYTKFLAVFSAACVGLNAAAHGQVTPKEVEADVKRAEIQHRQEDEQQARRTRMLQSLQATAADADELLGRLQAQLDSSMPTFEALKTNDDGKRLATDPVFVRDFIARSEESRVTPAQAKSRRSALNQIVTGLQAEMRKPNVGFLPDEKLKNEVEEASRWASAHLALVNRDLAWLDASLEEVRRNEVAIGPRTLATAIRDELARQQDLLNDAKRRGEDAALKDAAGVMNERAKELETLRQQQKIESMLRAAQAEIQVMKLQKEMVDKRRELDEREARARMEREYEARIAVLERERNEARAEQARLNAAAAVKTGAIENEADKLRRQASYNTPEVARRLQSTLAPLTTAGYIQPHLPLDKCIEKKKVSLAGLKAAGALHKTAEGYQTLALVLISGGGGPGNNAERDDARPKWGCSNEYFTAMTSSEKDHVIQVQQDLNDFGEFLVADGQLSP